jgi:hypothetical protein
MREECDFNQKKVWIKKIPKFNLNQYTFHEHEKTYVFSYPCWWIEEKSEVIIKHKHLLEKMGDSR